MYSLPLFPSATSPTRPTWRWFWPVLGLAFLARLAMAAWGDVLLHPDETYQYLEQAHRAVYGYGFIPWEYSFGIRSWLIPGGLAGILRAGQIVGLDAPQLYIPLIKGTLCLLSLLLPVGMYRLTQAVASERAAILAFLLGCFWHHFLYYAHKPMPGILATYALVWMVVLMLRAPGPNRLFLVGILSGLTLTLRYQLVPMLGLLNLFALIRLGPRGFGWVLLGNLAVLVLAGLLDLATWGGFLSSFIDNFRLNFSYDISSNFGRAPIDFYAKRFGVESGGLVLLAVLGAMMIWRRTWPVLIAVVIGVAALHVPAHKEFRFVIWAMPFVLAAAAVAACHPRLPNRLATPAVLLWGAATTLGFTSLYTGLQPYKSEARHGFAAFDTLSRLEHVTGVDIRADTLRVEFVPGYYGLHHPVPIFHASLQNSPATVPDVSHVITQDPRQGPAGFTRLRAHGPYVLWQADRIPPPADLDKSTLRWGYPANIPDDFRPFGTAAPIVTQGLPRRDRN